MTIYKLFCNTANDMERRKFGDHFFVSKAAAEKARESVLTDEVASLKAAYSVNTRTIGREAFRGVDGSDKINRVRITAAYKKDFSTGNYAGFWYEIAEIKTED